MNKQTQITLAQQTEQAMNDFMAAIPEEQQKIVGAAFAKLMASDVGAAAKLVGDGAPDFSLPNAAGGTVTLKDLLAQGPVVLNFYRGGWCPFCNLEFNALQAALPEIQSLGARLVGVTPETPNNALSTKEKNALEFDVLSDAGNVIARQYGLLMEVYEELRPLYRAWGIDLPAANGDESYELPLPATYVIDKAGVIRAAYVNKNYTQRMEPADIIAALKQL